MKVTLTRSIGREDLAALGLEGDEYTEGATVEVTEKVHKQLVERGLAALPGDKIRAVPVAATIKAPEKALPKHDR